MRSRRNSFAAALLAAVMLVSASSPTFGGADTNVSEFRNGAVQTASSKEDDLPTAKDLPASVDNSGKVANLSVAADALTTKDEGSETTVPAAEQATTPAAEQTTTPAAEQTATPAAERATTPAAEQTTTQTAQATAQESREVIAFAEQRQDETAGQKNADESGQEERIEIRRMYNPVMDCETTTEIYVDPMGNPIEEGVVPIESDEALEKQGVKVVRDMSDYMEAAGLDPSKAEPRGNLPSSVDNSKSEYFPKVTGQWGGSCMIYASVYYQFTYTYNKMNRIATDYDTLFSPRFTYNIHNVTDDSRGTNPIQCYEQYLKRIGAVTMAYAPFSDEGNTDKDRYYTDIFPEERVYRFAASHKIKSYFEYAQLGTDQTKITSCNDSDLTPVKTALANGELLTFYTYHNSLASVKLKENPNDRTLNAGEVGKECMIYCYGYEGCHEMTIVGYNDNIWVDLNNNGQVDDAERGAFKIVNSHGTNSHDNGFCWVSYDALNSTSAVSGAFNHGKRISIFYCIVSITMQSADYPAHAFIKYTLNTDDRFNVYCNVTGTANGKTVTKCMDPYVNRPDKEDIYVSLTGKKEADDGTILWDLLPMMEELGISDYNQATWTVSFEHKKDNGHNAIVKSCCLCDDRNYRFYEPEGVFPFTVQNSSRTITIPKTSHNYAVIYYQGYDNPSVYYSLGGYGSNSSKELKMTRNYDKPLYNYVATIDLGFQSSISVSFGNETGRDNNNGYFYTVTPGELFFRNRSKISPLKLNYRKNLKDVDDVGCTLVMYANATGGCGPYYYRYSITDTKTGSQVFSTVYDRRSKGVETCITTKQYEYPLNDVTQYELVDESSYRVQIDVKDAEGRTASSYFTQGIKDEPFHISCFKLVNPQSVYQAGQQMTFHFTTENDKYTPGSFFTYIHFYKDGKFLERKLCYPTGISSSMAKMQDNDVLWTPPSAGNYRAIIIRVDNNTEYDYHVLDFKVTGGPVSLSGVSITPNSGYYGGTSISITAGAVGGDGKYQYKYSYIRNGIETVLQDYKDDSSSYSFTAPGDPGKYTFCIRVKDGNGAGADYYKDFQINSSYIRDITVPTNGLFKDQDNLIGISGRTASNLSDKNLFFVVEKDRKTEELPTTGNNSLKWKPTSVGSYKITALIKCGKMVIARKSKTVTVSQGFSNPDPNPDQYKITVAVVNYIENEGQQSNYRLRYWNNGGFFGDATLNKTGRTITASVGNENWGGAAQTFIVYEAFIPKASTGYKFHINDRWFGNDGYISSTKGVYIFQYDYDKALYANIA